MSLPHDTLLFGKPTFTFAEFFNSYSVHVCFMDIFGGLVIFGFPVENILSQIQLWKTMMAQAKLQNI